MKKVIINENQKGFLFNGGKFVKLLEAGTYRVFGGREIEIVFAAEAVASGRCGVRALLANADVAAAVTSVEVGDSELALHFLNGVFAGAIEHPGTHAFWASEGKHEFKLVDISNPDVGDTPEYIFSLLPGSLYRIIEVAEYQKGSLYFNRRFVRMLEPGTHFFWAGATDVRAVLTDMRLTGLCIVGQEIMTQDKIALRLSFVCNYRVLDCLKAQTETDDYVEQLRVAAQLAMRECIGREKLDDILLRKDELQSFIFGRLKEKGRELSLEITDAGIKDIILPGEIRSIMNTVLVAEKRAQANVITRREEVASTRSLLNTAKLMDENKTLYRLKELEHVEHICENVGTLNLGGGGDILSQLISLSRPREGGHE